MCVCVCVCSFLCSVLNLFLALFSHICIYRQHFSTHTRMHTSIHARTNVSAHARMHACMHAHMHPPTHLPTHTHTHTHTSYQQDVVFDMFVSVCYFISLKRATLLKVLHAVFRKLNLSASSFVLQVCIFTTVFGVGSIIITFYFIFYKQPCSQLQIIRQGVACTVTVCMKKLSRMEIRTQSRARAVTPDHLDLEPTR